MKSQTQENTSYELTRVFFVPKERVFDSFLEEDVLKQIWGIKSITVDARPEGKSFAKAEFNGENWNFVITYKEIIPKERIKWIVQFERFPQKETRVTLTFKDVPRGTEIYIRMENFENSQERDDNREAWKRALKLLEKILTKK